MPKVKSFDSTTTAGGNVSYQFANKVIVLSAYTNIPDVVVVPFPGSGAGEDGQYTWWFNCYIDNATHTAFVDSAITIRIVYITV